MDKAIKITSMGKKNPYYRVTLHGSDGKPLLSREFTERHVAIGMAYVVGNDLEIEPDLTITAGTEDTGSEGAE